MATNTKQRGCGQKVPHPTRKAAETHMWNLVRKGAALARVNVYRCKHCPSWHVGHKPRHR
ncbi:MAG TPA: hypothetical protein VF484_00860 [Candidatus Limnocylindrales bacterium]